MAEYPALPLFTDAFIADTIHLNAQQTGAYLMLLICAWRTKDCALPDDDKILAKYARMSLGVWKRNKDVVMSFWNKKNGKWIQKRLTDERLFCEEKKQKAISAGKASALKRKERHLTGVNFELELNGNPHTHTHTHNKPPNPLKRGNGVENKFSGVFKTELFIKDEGIEDAKENAPGWDVYHLMRIYDEGIMNGKRQPPKNINRAFPAWCAKYTKGKQP